MKEYTEKEPKKILFIVIYIAVKIDRQTLYIFISNAYLQAAKFEVKCGLQWNGKFHEDDTLY